MIELLVASTFLTVGISGTLLVNTASHKLRRTASETRAATALLGNMAEAMRPQSVDDLVATYAEGADMIVADPVLDGAVLTFDHNGFVPGDDSVAISLTATWTTFNGTQRSLTFDTVY